MQITLRQRLEQFSHRNQTRLFDFLEQQAGTLTDKTRLLVSALGMLPLSRLIAPTRGWKGRPSKDRQALATAFLAKSILGLQTTRQLLDRLQVDRTLACDYPPIRRPKLSGGLYQLIAELAGFGFERE